MKTFFSVMSHGSCHQAKCYEMYFLKAIPLTLLNAVVVLAWLNAGSPRLYYEIKWAHVKGLEWYHMCLDFCSGGLMLP